ncbi:chlorophyll synthase [Quercus suber]|uniref:Chlorophyll synthase n=1 Tax=Quercus suber TaxID=58331 RepID=A0AAW0L0V2_QUESU
MITFEEIINGIFSNAVSFFMKWLWSLKSTTKTAISGRPMMKFESGYTVETVFDGSKLGIEPYSVEMLPGGELLVLDSANSNLYRISASLPLFAANYLWLASKLEESPRKARQVLNVFHKIECRMENLPIEHLEIRSQFQYFLEDPVKYDVKYQASAQPFLVLGLLVTALATSH